MSIQTDLQGEQEGISRRSMLTRSAGVGIALSGSVTGLFGTGTAHAGVKDRAGKAPNGAAGYGKLIDDPDGILSLPEGFSYKVVAHAGDTKLDSGEFTPSDPDGTAAFVRRGGAGTVLINNHEVSGSEPFPVPHPDGFVYDSAAKGGTTNIVVDNEGNRVREYVSLAGTHNNCAGGKSPWGTWLTCEETEGFTAQTKPHGYVFEVDPHDQDANRDPKPIKAMGRYAHEALCIDPDIGVTYLTEDAGNPNGLLYRWTPPDEALPLDKGVLRTLADDAGTLEAMKASLDGTHVPDLSPATEPGTTYAIEWVTVPDRDAASTSTRKQFTNSQITRSRKYEGMWWGDGGAYFVCSFARTTDGSAAEHDGQIWFLDPLAQTIELKLHFAYTPADQDDDVDGPDNITVSAYGGLIIAEDGDGKNHLVGSTESGEAFFFARNEIDNGSSEFAGPTFSNDKKILFAGIQVPGYVLAITGPFTRQR